MPEFRMKVNWNLYQLMSYMQTWSAVKKYHQEKKHDPLDLIRDELKRAWGDDGGLNVREVIWKINLRVGMVTN